MADRPDPERVTRRETPGPFAVPTRPQSDADLFPDDEAPTRPGGLQARGAVLLAVWRCLSHGDQMAVERYAEALPRLTAADRAWFERMLDMAMAARR